MSICKCLCAFTNLNKFSVSYCIIYIKITVWYMEQFLLPFPSCPTRWPTDHSCVCRRHNRTLEVARDKTGVSWIWTLPDVGISDPPHLHLRKKCGSYQYWSLKKKTTLFSPLKHTVRSLIKGNKWNRSITLYIVECSYSYQKSKATEMLSKSFNTSVSISKLLGRSQENGLEVKFLA